MRLAIQFTEREERKAVPILLRHSQGMELRGRICIVNARALRAAGVRVTAAAEWKLSFGSSCFDRGSLIRR